MSTHSPKFITEMKTQLEAEKTKLEQELSAIARKSGNDYQAKFPDYGRNEEDNATEIGDYAAFSATEKTLEERLRNVNKSLGKIEAGTYGITEEGELIPEDRLRANPAATTIIK